MLIEYGMVWCGMKYVGCCIGMVLYGMVWYDMVLYGMVWYDMVLYGIYACITWLTGCSLSLIHI